MSHEELQSFLERFQNIMKCQDKQIKRRRLQQLQSDLRESYNIPQFVNWQLYSKEKPEVANVYRLVVEALSQSAEGRLG